MYKKKNDINGCDRIDLDDNMVKINNEFSKLRCLEYIPDESMESKYIHFKPVFYTLYTLLYETNSYSKITKVLYQDFMKELYYRSVYYYPIVNKILKMNKIPVYSYIKNNQCLVPLIENKVKYALLHFDTHPDYNDVIDHKKKFENLLSNLGGENDKDILDNISEITYDIGCFSSYYTTFSNENFIWIYPDWNSNEKPSVHYNKKFYEVQGNLNQCSFEYLCNHLSKNYILSIDLDYFTTNGTLKEEIEKYELDLDNDEADPASFGRTRFKSEFSNPYNYFDDLKLKDTESEDSEITKYGLSLNKEFKLVNKRLKKVKNFLLYTVSKRIYPKIIVLSDSTNIILTKNISSISVTNDFCPTLMVLYIRKKLISILNSIYGNHKLNEFP